MSIDEFVAQVYINMGAPRKEMQMPGYWHNLASWFPHRKDENVLWLHYEDLMQDLAGCVDLIADFLGIGGNDAELKATVTHQVHVCFV